MTGTGSTGVAWQRGTFALCALAYAAFVVYGSLVPLRFEPTALSTALARFQSVVTGPFDVDSRSDLATNFVLFVPLGYLLLAALRTDRGGAAGHAGAFVLTAGAGVLLASLIEFVQVFFPSRTVALSDLSAESVGGVSGAVLWFAVGERITTWLREFSRERERPELLQRLLVLYAVGFFASQVLPLDLTVSLGELARKYRQGGIILVPFTFSHSSWLLAFWDYSADTLLSAPLGAAGVLVWTEPGSRRRALYAFALAASAAAFVELAQVFVMSRYADVTDVITGGTGAAIGVALTRALSRRQVAEHLRERPAVVTRVARIALPVWLGVLAAYHWWPFDFSLSAATVTAGVRRLLQIPFFSYYLGTEFHAFTEMARKALLAFPLGALLGLSFPNRRVDRSRLRTSALAVIGFLLLCGIEVGQVFLQTRYPDLTDAFIGSIGVVAGLRVATLLGMRGRDRRLQPRDGANQPVAS